MNGELSALRAVDFEWADRLDRPWRSPRSLLPTLQASAARDLAHKLATFDVEVGVGPRLGIALLGPAGSGKSDLLGSLRLAAQERGCFFVYADLTTPSQLDASLALATVRSLSQLDRAGRPQHRALVEHLLLEHADAALRADGAASLCAARPPGLITRCDRLIDAVWAQHGGDPHASRDVLRAVLLIASEHPDLIDLGEAWLAGIALPREEAELHGFQRERAQPAAVVLGLCWLMSLARPLVLALDHLDAAVTDHELASPRSTSDGDLRPSAPPSASAVATSIERLLGANQRALVVVACREETWAALERRSASSLQGRFEAPIVLRPLTDAASLRSLVAIRLQPAYRAASVSPAYPCYPFRDEFFAELAGAPPRELYERCDAHRHECLRVGRVVETGHSLAPPRPAELAVVQRRFEELLVRAPGEALLAAEDEPALGALIESAAEALARHENPTRPGVDVALDVHFPGHSPGRPSYEPLHARIRLAFGDAERQRCYAFRFLQRSQDRAFQVRLAAAITASGIAPGAAHTRLCVLRVGAPPASAASERLVAELRARGGLLLAPSRTDLSALWAIARLREDPELSHLLPAWLSARRPVSRISVFLDAVRWLYSDTARPHEPVLDPLAAPSSHPPSAEPSMRRSPSSTRKRTHPGLGRLDQLPPSAALAKGLPSRVPASARGLSSSRPPAHGAVSEPRLLIGERAGSEAAGSVEVALSALRNHAMLLAGEGSARTNLIRRLIEEAVLLGVPAVIVDREGDLSLLGEERASAPEGWRIGDERRARAYHEQSEVVIWTPGIHRGNPLSLAALPELGMLAADPEALEAALASVVASLGALIAPATARPNPDALVVLLGALRLFAGQGGGSLKNLIGLLADLPAPACGGIPGGAQLARQLSEQLEVERRLDPLLAETAPPIDPELLLGRTASGRTRISVINLSGLPSERARQQLVHQLAMTLFCCIEKRSSPERPLLGLLVIDELRELAPATRSVASRESLLSLLPRARKYGLGMLLASEAPKSVDARLIAGCATHFYGRVSSPAGIEALREQLRRRGGGGNDVATLMPNVFYAHTEGMTAPIRLVPLPCLSAPAPSPPGELELIRRAQRSRAGALHV